MYLYLKEVNRTGKAFQDVTSQYWNLIYKKPSYMTPYKIPNQIYETTQSEFEKAENLINIVDIDNEVSPNKHNMKFDMPGGLAGT